jgi:hypothetical protein
MNNITFVLFGKYCPIIDQLGSKDSSREENFNPMNSTTFVLFGKYCPIIDQLGSKDSSRDFQLNCVISYFFVSTFNTPYQRLKIDVMERE